MSPLVCDLFLWYFTERGTTGHIIKPNQVTKKKKNPKAPWVCHGTDWTTKIAKNIYLIHDQGQVSPNQTLKIPFVQNLLIKALSKSVCLTDLVIMMIFYPIYTADVRGGLTSYPFFVLILRLLANIRAMQCISTEPCFFI